MESAVPSEVCVPVAAAAAAEVCPGGDGVGSTVWLPEGLDIDSEDDVEAAAVVAGAEGAEACKVDRVTIACRLTIEDTSLTPLRTPDGDKEPRVKEPRVKEPRVKELRVKELRVKELRVKEPRVKEPRVKEPIVKELRVKELRVKELRDKEPRDKEPRVKEPRVKEPIVKELRVKEPRVKESRVKS